MTPKIALVGAGAVFAVLDQAWKYLQGGVIGAAAFIGACATLWIWVVRPFIKRCSAVIHHASAAHTVILGDPERDVPSLSDRLDHQDERLERGDEDFGRIEAKVDDLRNDISGRNGVKQRIAAVEGVLDVMGATERHDIRTALAAARVHPRRATDPPLPDVTPLPRRED